MSGDVTMVNAATNTEPGDRDTHEISEVGENLGDEWRALFGSDSGEDDDEITSYFLGKNDKSEPSSNEGGKQE